LARTLPEPAKTGLEQATSAKAKSILFMGVWTFDCSSANTADLVARGQHTKVASFRLIGRL
jgi:hypothetical protein